MSFTSSSISQFAGYKIQSAIRCALRILENSTCQKEDFPHALNGVYSHNFTIVSQTQASVAKSRPKCLGQEDHCASAEDIVIVKILVPKVFLVSSPLRSDMDGHFIASDTPTRQSRKEFLLNHLGNYVPEFLSQSHWGLDSLDCVSVSSVNLKESTLMMAKETYRNGKLRLHGIRILDDDDEEEFQRNGETNVSSNADLYPPSYRKIHAEQSCTQQVYHGLIPVEWLPNSTEIIHWYHTSYHEPVRHLRAPIPNTIRYLKQILRSMESLEQTRSDALNGVEDTTMEIDSLSSSGSISCKMDDHTRSAKAAARGRYGALAYRIPRYWHNYADPSLRISPNYDPAYRVIDRARIVDFVAINATNSDGITCAKDTDRLYVVCNIIGDQFLQQQVRRMLGTAIAMINGWLPIHSFFDQSIDPAAIIETPVIPSILVYRAGARYHWNEVDGQRLFCYSKAPSPEHELISFSATDDPIHWLHTQLSETHRLSEHDLKSWFINLRDVVCPRIREQVYNRFEKPRPVWHPNSLVQLPNPPDAYRAVLSILRYIISNGLWPSTSLARSSVMSSSSFYSNTTTIEAFTNHALNGGSFTVVNTKILQETNCPIPKANILFPELTKAVFELEEWIIESGTASGTFFHHAMYGPSPTSGPCTPQEFRLPSTHCAVNCNAQFLPHVDSGRGLGQSTSMIVGLGDYVGGEIVVEQIGYAIRYHPLEFDGWNLRHWTNAFAGPDRFSLVWFTPATSTLSD